jgi:hypothetical protein
MGTIDKTVYKLKCLRCKTEEDASVLDKGSNWGGSSWQGGATFKHFETKWQGGGIKEPDLTEAKCRVCSSEAIVEVN